jgi:hypothetical protein
MTDDDLKEPFASMKRADRAPPFASMWRPRPRRGLSPWLLALPAAAVLVLVLWKALSRPSQVSAVVVTPQVEAPLDFLLETPRALHGVPDFDHEPR